MKIVFHVVFDMTTVEDCLSWYGLRQNLSLMLSHRLACPKTDWAESWHMALRFLRVPTSSALSLLTICLTPRKDRSL